MQLMSLVCPRCHGTLLESPDLFTCTVCGQVYPVILGIPRLLEPDEQTDDKPALIQRLVEIYPSATFEELVQTRIQDKPNPEELRRQYADYALSMRERGERFHRMFRVMLSREPWSMPQPDRALDIGCGVGAGLTTLSREFEHVVGLDINLASLIAAKKLLETGGLRNVTLVQASANQLPFSDETFDYVTALNVLEHVFTPVNTLKEVYRVLVSGGAFCGDSRNRYDLFFPEPHVKLRWLGFLPRRWMEPYVRWRRAAPYDYTHLLSYGELRVALRAAFGTQGDVVVPGLTAYNVPNSIDCLVARLAKVTLLRSALVRLSPSHLALAHR
jgi:ubiquinone/menaquinone biosynthesis C-methylase UbiE/uncharacterized protein YbaR (Trm112 family)